MHSKTSLGNSGLCWTVFARNRDTAVPAEGNGDLQTLICVLVARPRQCLTLSNPVPWQNWMAAYLGYTLRMKTLFRGWRVMVHDTHTRRRRRWYSVQISVVRWQIYTTPFYHLSRVVTLTVINVLECFGIYLVVVTARLVAGLIEWAVFWGRSTRSVFVAITRNQTEN